MIQVIRIPNIPLINPGDDISRILLDTLKKESIKIENEDVFVIAQAIISKSENRIVDLKSITPSSKAKEYAKSVEKDPRIIELILQESKQVLKYNSHAMIVEHKSGLVCANAGIDQSNSGKKDHVTLLPNDPDNSASIIQMNIEKSLGKNIGVIISDTQGRPFRNGAINVGIGIAGFKDPVLNFKGKIDLFGYKLQTTEVNIIDELASVAELLMGESDEGYPIILIKGFKFELGTSNSSRLIRKKDEDLFRGD